MSASDDARQAVAEAPVGREWDEDSPDAILAAVMPDGRTIAQHLDDGAVALRLLTRMTQGEVYGDGGRLEMFVGDEGHTLPLAALDPEAADLLARLEAQP